MKWFRRRKPNRRVADESAPPRRWQPVAWALAGIMVMGAAVAGISMYLQDIEWKRFRALEITGDMERVSAGDVQAVLQPFIADGFAGIDLRAAQRSLEDLPWVAHAAVRREWPGTLVVRLREERPVATWFGTALLNADGEVFVDGAAGYSGVLPDVGGPVGSQQDMIARLYEVRAAAERAGLDLRRLLRTERRAERFWLDTAGGEEIEVRLGRHDADVRLKRFLKVAWPRLSARSARIDYVDMRYTNGFAVGWKTPAENDGSRGERG